MHTLQAGFHSVGSAASVKQITSRSHPRPQFSLLLIGQCRIRIDDITQEIPYVVAKVTQLGNSNSAGVYVVMFWAFMHVHTLSYMYTVCSCRIHTRACRHYIHTHSAHATHTLFIHYTCACTCAHTHAHTYTIHALRMYMRMHKHTYTLTRTQTP